MDRAGRLTYERLIVRLERLAVTLPATFRLLQEDECVNDLQAAIKTALDDARAGTRGVPIPSPVDLKRTLEAHIQEIHARHANVPFTDPRASNHHIIAGSGKENRAPAQYKTNRRPLALKQTRPVKHDILFTSTPTESTTLVPCTPRNMYPAIMDTHRSTTPVDEGESRSAAATLLSIAGQGPDAIFSSALSHSLDIPLPTSDEARPSTAIDSQIMSSSPPSLSSVAAATPSRSTVMASTAPSGLEARLATSIPSAIGSAGPSRKDAVRRTHTSSNNTLFTAARGTKRGREDFQVHVDNVSPIDVNRVGRTAQQRRTAAYGADTPSPHPQQMPRVDDSMCPHLAFAMGVRYAVESLGMSFEIAGEELAAWVDSRMGVEDRRSFTPVKEESVEVELAPRVRVRGTDDPRVFWNVL
ncbi:hypothetical protein E8E13_009032 [Curvularia kusanoi]|uniref:Uncharacterized protein n=1 Tax=Curvularia kusanoi TaxID=90978 RepID=A0A9P4WCP7_CURKU|nr:hypothetical protein E8E13_009032 [Curvularia kusanoi]